MPPADREKCSFFKVGSTERATCITTGKCCAVCSLGNATAENGMAQSELVTALTILPPQDHLCEQEMPAAP